MINYIPTFAGGWVKRALELISSTFAGLTELDPKDFSLPAQNKKSLTRYIELAENHKRNCVSPIKTYHLSNVKKKKKIVLFVVSY